MRSFQRVFIAGRGVAARRVIRAARELGIETVVLIRDSDAEASWPDQADYAVYLPDPPDGPWPDARQVIDAALDAGCDVVHPGWGRLARDPLFSQQIASAGMASAGPGTVQLAAVADRGILRQLADQLDIPTVPGSEPIADTTLAQTWLQWTGWPAILKSVDEVAGGPAERIEDDAAGEERLAARLARGPVLLERFVVGAREIEVPLVGDGQGLIITLGVRDITVRVGGERALAEAPVWSLSDSCRVEVREHAIRLARQLQWNGAGAVRFLVTPDGRPYFLTFRPGVQAWDAVTEMVFGVDLVDLQFRLAAGDALGWNQADIDASAQSAGHAIGLRLVAQGASLSGGAGQEATVSGLVWPEDLRLDAGPAQGDVVRLGEELGLITVHAPTRQAAIVRLKAALDELVVQGVDVGLDRIRRLIDAPAFWLGPLDRDAVARTWQSPPEPMGRPQLD